MEFAFDLWSRDDVQAHAADILEQLKQGHHALRQRLAAREGPSVPALDRVRLPAVSEGWTRAIPGHLPSRHSRGPR